jgi:ABC-type transport system substrate-binding protein
VATDLIPPSELDLIATPSQVDGLLKSLPSYPYSVAKAKAELAKSPYPKGFHGSTLTTSYSSYVPVDEVIAYDLKQIGINLVPKTVSVDDFFTVTAAAKQKLPAVYINCNMAGDFNADPDAASIRYLKGRQSLAGQSVLYHDAWALAGEGPGYTWSAAENPIASALMDQIVRQPRFRLRIDYVFVGSAGFQERPGAHASVQRADLAFNRAVDGIWPSDHFGVLVELDVGKEPLADPDLYPI